MSHAEITLNYGYHINSLRGKGFSLTFPQQSLAIQKKKLTEVKGLLWTKGHRKKSGAIATRIISCKVC